MVAAGLDPDHVFIHHIAALDAVTADEDEEDTSAKRPAKAPRMTTNKSKATNYYTTANVKNRNRERKNPRTSTGGGGGSGRKGTSGAATGNDEGKRKRRR